VLRYIVLDVTYALERLAFCRSDPQSTVVSMRFPEVVVFPVQLKLDMHFVVAGEHPTNASDLHSWTAADESGHSLRRQKDV
jgi:hypothetical protein